MGGRCDRISGAVEYLNAGNGMNAACPVCRWPDGGLAACRQCGTELRAGYAAGQVSPAGERELADRITAAQLRHDLRSAIMAASRPGERDYPLLATLGRLARGGPPLANEIERAEEEFDAAAPKAPAAAGLGFTLSRLVAGEIDGIEFVEIGPDSISAETLIVNDLCVPVRSPHGESHPWPSVVPALAADEGLRRFQLAGGIGEAAGPGQAVAPAVLAKAAETAVRQAVRHRLEATTAVLRAVKRGERAADESGDIPGWPPVRLDTVLVRRTMGWPVLEAAAARARALMRPVAEIADLGTGTLADIVDRTGRGAPLRYGYALVLADVNPRTGEVKPDPWPLFKPGTVIRQHYLPAENAYVKAPPSAADQLALPVVMRRGMGAADWPAVGMATMPGSAQETTQLKVRLMAPGQVSFYGTPGVGRPDGRTLRWPELLTGLPSRVPAEIALDLMLFMELGGSADAVAGRVALATDVVSKLHRSDARIAVVGYRDHFHHHYTNAVTARERLIVGCGLEEISGARSALASRGLWQAVEVRDDYAAPLEDALDWVRRESPAWRTDARHLLVVLGSRPPHPGDVYDDANARATVCPHHLAWRDILGRLRREHTVECVVVRHSETAPRPADDIDHAWQEFYTEGSFAPVDTTSADDLMAAVGLIPGGNGSRLSLAVRAEGSSSQRRRAGSA
jgi:hypothetical protein